MIQRVFSLVTCLLMMLAVAINQNKQIAGHELIADASADKTSTEETETLRYLQGGTWVISTRALAKDVMGFGGPTPLEIVVKNNRIAEIHTLPNDETPVFFDKVKGSGLFDKWIGRTPEEALKVEVDAVSGATLSSNAVIKNMKAGLQYAANVQQDDASTSTALDYSLFYSPKFICTVLVILMGSLLPVIRVRFPHYRKVQLLLNVVVLGFWSGSFISYSLIVNYLSNGVNVYTGLVPILLLIVGFIFPLFGKKSHYCTWLCPLGSLQELTGKCVKRKWKFGPRTLTWLNRFHDYLWMSLMLLMWSGVCFEWMDYELFTAFIFRQASTVVIVVAVSFLLLSCVVARPYCRFVCPTGCLLRNAQGNK